MTPIIPRPVLKSTTRSADLTQNIVNLPLPMNTHRSRQQNALPVPQRFKIVESLGVNGTCSLDLGDEELADLAYRLVLPGLGVSRENCLFIGPKDQLKELLDFANLFTSVRGQLSSGVETELGQICANLVLIGDMTTPCPAARLS